MTLQELALSYAERGFAIFPIYGIQEVDGKFVCDCEKIRKKKCENPGKHPLTPRGFLEATTNLSTIKALWDKWPNANIGMATGEISGVVVIDIDGPEGVVSLSDKTLPATLTAASGRADGGIHYYFQWPGFKVKNAVKLLDGVDIRADGGYIILPGSRHSSGNYYKWLDETEPSPAPQWMLDTFQAQTEKSETPEELEPVPKGSRNVYLTGVAGALRRKGLSFAAIRAALLIHNQERLEEPLDSGEVEKIAESVSAMGAADPNPPQVVSFILDDELGDIKYHDICKSAELTDLGNAKVFATLYAGRFLYDHIRKKWMVWAEGAHVWREDAMAAARRGMMATLQMRKQAGMMISDDRERAAHLQGVRRAENGRAIESALEKAASFKQIATVTSRFNQYPMLLNCLNGTYDLSAGIFRDSKPSDLISSQANVAYDPKATCPLWDGFIREIFQDDTELIAYVKRALGLCLSGDISEQAFFVAYGSGANGKSTMLNTVTRLLGDYGKTTPFDTFDADSRNQYGNDLAALQGTRLVIAIESEQHRKLAEARIKSITGGDDISCRFLYGEFFSFRPQFKVWLAVNHRPQVRGSDHGIWRRIHLIPFNRKFEGDSRDLQLEKKLARELPGILNWLIEGFHEWKRHGLQPPAVVMEATKDYKRENDSVALWLEERCILHDEKEISATEAYTDFREYLKSSGEVEKAIMSLRSWGQLMSEKGFQKYRGPSGRWTYRGLDVRPLEVGNQGG